MSDYPNVICKLCNEPFETQIKIDPAIYAMVPNLRVGENTFTCPSCDKRSNYSEKDFMYSKPQADKLAFFGKIVEAIISVVEESRNPLKMATEMLGDFEQAKSSNDPSIFNQSSHLKFLKKWIPDTPEKLAAYVVIGQLVVQSLINQPQDKIDQRTIINNFNQTLIIEQKQTSISNIQIKKVGRNEKCSCGSNKKYKHCHGKL